LGRVLEIKFSGKECRCLARHCKAASPGQCGLFSKSLAHGLSRTLSLQTFWLTRARRWYQNSLKGRMTFATETDQGDRVRIMYAIHSTLADLFVNASDEGRWLRDRLAILENMSPLAYMLRKRIPGMLAVRDLVERRMANR
jgi:hypothetical protein